MAIALQRAVGGDVAWADAASVEEGAGPKMRHGTLALVKATMRGFIALPDRKCLVREPLAARTRLGGFDIQRSHRVVAARWTKARK